MGSTDRNDGRGYGGRVKNSSVENHGSKQKTLSPPFFIQTLGSLGFTYNTWIRIKGNRKVIKRMGDKGANELADKKSKSNTVKALKPVPITGSLHDTQRRHKMPR